MNEQLRNLEIGIKKEEVLSILGSPKKEFINNNYEVLQYGSIAPSLADSLYFENGILVLKELSLKTNSIKLIDIIAEYGSTDLFYALSKPELEDSFNTTVFAWPEKGRDVFVLGNSADDKVLLYREFSPKSINDYESTFGKIWSERKVDRRVSEVVSNNHLSLTSSEVQEIRDVELQRNNSKNIVVVTIITIFILFIIVFIFIKKRKKRSEEIIREN